ncbi:hypothetical protein BDK51DRAFT_31197 [Blyttiomyces helicus]|uniref:Uncharacterized protein n=1 Tax=Blyttiomyces helicus TaxID=388810 RepID=A0A4P9WNK4_9FUNG|nr:hypothetical protein BDK51DRAFT_31197 [Blyttiomyces helicus]|eukprot:RKO93278.1 hypothetical protein BDK51DRAFT_31197 [Blyttiomyces helicus]
MFNTASRGFGAVSLRMVKFYLTDEGINDTRATCGQEESYGGASLDKNQMVQIKRLTQSRLKASAKREEYEVMQVVEQAGIFQGSFLVPSRRDGNLQKKIDGNCQEQPKQAVGTQLFRPLLESDIPDVTANAVFKDVSLQKSVSGARKPLAVLSKKYLQRRKLSNKKLFEAREFEKIGLGDLADPPTMTYLQAPRRY